MASRIIPLLPLFVLILGFSLMLADARILEIYIFGLPTANKHEMRISTRAAQNESACTLCEEFTAEAVEYLSQNKTQKEIMDTLHEACSTLHSFENQCIVLVDYYAHIFFMKVAAIDPHLFCEKVNLCEKETLLSQLGQEQVCTICQNTANQILDKLKDPETEMDIIQTLLRACGQLENYSQQCKRLVFEYGPVILANVEKFLETADICTALHFCKANELPILDQAFPAELHLRELLRQHLKVHPESLL